MHDRRCNSVTLPQSGALCAVPAKKPRREVQVWAQTETGDRYWGDVLIGADGIWSKVREQLVGHSDACYSDYTCYTGISDFVTPDIDTVAYRVFLGNGQYFVSSDVGGGKMQWYAFHEEAAGGTDAPGTQKARLMKIFGRWYVPAPRAPRCPAAAPAASTQRRASVRAGATPSRT